uniref:Uncharacterized protein n=1 Tax=Oryza sativa subsp. japonica TaxID=39947 RepID=Q5YLZ0_ORYSJ|nr:hypothetical protein [Oryza sativa Japonica Group]
MGQGVRQTASRHLTLDLTDFFKGSGCLGPRGWGKRNPTPPSGEIRRRADTSPSGPTSPKVPGHVGDCVCLKPLVMILPVPYHRQ